MVERKYWRKKYDNFDASPLVPPCYNELYLYSSIERWFE